MQIKSLRIKSYKSRRIDDKASPTAIARLKKLELYDQLRREGVAPVLALTACSAAARWGCGGCRQRGSVLVEGVA